MPVFNGGQFLREAVGSILSQTFTDFEFLIIDDGSTDSSFEILSSFQDKRIRIERNERNLGLINTLNKGIQLSFGTYIARMDADDISLPGRLAAQVQAMESDRNLALLGTAFKRIPGGSIVRNPTRSDDIRLKLFISCAFGHPTVMFRKAVIQSLSKQYDPIFSVSEDYELWTRVTEVFKTGNLPEVYLLYRDHEAQVSVLKKELQIKQTNEIRLRLASQLITFQSETEKMIYTGILNKKFENSALWLNQAGDILKRLLQENENKKLYPQTKFHRLLGSFWFKACHRNNQNKREIAKMYFRNPLSKAPGSHFSERVKIAIRLFMF